MTPAAFASEAAVLVTSAIANRTDAERAPLLRALLAHAVAGLVVIEGEAETSEAVYRLADAVATRGTAQEVAR